MALIYLTNSLNEDPFLFVEKPGVREGFLFDCGLRLRGNVRRLRKLAALFITHAHIDHMIGLDRLVRALLGESLDLRIFGPTGMIQRVAGRLASYDWDKSADQSLTLDVTEVTPEGFRRARFECRHRFRLEPLPDEPVRAELIRADEYGVEWAVMDHGGSVCLAFACVEDGRWKIRPEALDEMELPPGPWVGELIRRIEAEAPPEEMVETPRGPLSLGSLADRLTWFQPGQRIAYVTDTRFTPAVQTEVARLAHQADIMICEATFLEEDRQAALDYHHLTARDAATLAQGAQARRLLLNHPSRRYHGRYEELLREARELFPRASFVSSKRRGVRIGSSGSAPRG